MSINVKLNQQIFIEEIFLNLEKPKYCRDIQLVKKTYPYSVKFNKLSYTEPFRVLSIDAVELILKIFKINNIKKNKTNLQNVSHFINNLLISKKILGLCSSLTRSFLFPNCVTYDKNFKKSDYILVICLKKSIIFRCKTIEPGFGILLKTDYLNKLDLIENFIILHYQSKPMSFL